MTKGKCFDLLSNSLNQFVKETYGDQSAEFVRSWLKHDDNHRKQINVYYSDYLIESGAVCIWQFVNKYISVCDRSV